MASPVLLVTICLLGSQVVYASDYYRDGFMDKLTNNPHPAPTRRQPPFSDSYESQSEEIPVRPGEVNEAPSPLAPLKNLVRLFGLQPNQISAVAVNALVFVAQMAAKNETLPDSIEAMIREQGSAEETSCIRLLVCKITPFVNKMQKAVFGKEDQNGEPIRGAAIMYRHLPSADEINDRHDICEKRHRDCSLNE
ncbi:Proctolin peptide [Operophtera brumata]|uniref:Proctolin peptide n=1 Tax=Operophtera brumata TaxID=104452 RepID=A0A0L7LKX0_OPEBR|nr:Proctolin peptide [Operophtera brumata]